MAGIPEPDHLAVDSSTCASPAGQCLPTISPRLLQPSNQTILLLNSTCASPTGQCLPTEFKLTFLAEPFDPPTQSPPTAVNLHTVCPDLGSAGCSRAEIRTYFASPGAGALSAANADRWFAEHDCDADGKVTSAERDLMGFCGARGRDSYEGDST